MTISFVGHTEVGVSAATTTVTHPTGITADDWLVLVANSKATSRVPTAPADWTDQGNIFGGAGAAGADTGITRLTYWSQLADGAETGTFDITWSSSATNFVVEGIWRKTVAGAWSNAFAFGDDAAQSTGVDAISVTANSDPGFAAGDHVIVVYGLTTDTGTLTNPDLTIPGCTLGTLTERTLFRSAAGNDGGLWVFSAAVTAGTSTSAPIFTADSDNLNASAGPGLFVRLREPAGGTSATPTPAAVATTASLPAPTLSAGSTPTPVATAGTTAVPTPTPVVNATAAPAAIAAAASLPTPTAIAGSSATPTPAAIAAASTFPALSTEQDWTADPAAILASAVVPTPSTGSGAVRSPATVAASAAVPTPSVFAGGNVTASPAAIAVPVALNTPTVSVSASATPSSIAITTTVPTPGIGIGTDSTVNPAAITATVTMPAVTFTAASSMAVAAVAVTTTMPSAITVLSGNSAARRTSVATARRSSVATPRRG